MSYAIAGVAALSTPGRTTAELAGQNNPMSVDVGGTPSAQLDARLFELTQRRFRRLGRFIQLAMVGAVEAAHRAKLPLPPERTGVFLATGLGNISDLLPFSQAVFGDPGFHTSAIQFANSVGNAGAFYIAQALNVTGPVVAVSQDEVSFESALLQAVCLLDDGDIDVAVVGAVDVVMPPIDDHLARMGYRADAENAQRKLSEGSAWWVLSKDAPHRVGTLDEVQLQVEARADTGVRGESDGRAVSFDVGTVYAASALYPTLFLEQASGAKTLTTIARTREGLTGRTTVSR